ncbi:MAG TPA: hypothetical protein VGO59_05525 [Verrucomicrobiae bacterium]
MFILVLGGALAAGFASAQDKAADLAIVVNAACSLENVSSAELVKIFKAQRTTNPDGVKYVLAACQTGTPEHSAALKAIYRMTDSDYERYFLQATFAGSIQAAPKAFLNGLSVRQFVAAAPGAIGYLRASEADKSVKVVRIDGKAPGELGYPLKIRGANAP